MRKNIHYISTRNPEEFGWKMSCGKDRKQVRFVHYLFDRVTCPECIKAEDKLRKENQS